MQESKDIKDIAALLLTCEDENIALAAALCVPLNCRRKVWKLAQQIARDTKDDRRCRDFISMHTYIADKFMNQFNITCYACGLKPYELAG